MDALFPGSHGAGRRERPADAARGERGALDGVYFVGFDVRQAGGLLRTIAAQALSVAERIGARSRASAHVLIGGRSGPD